MVFLHVLLTKSGIFSARIPTYLILRYLAQHGHRNLIINGDKGIENCERVASAGENLFQNLKIVSQVILNHRFDVVFVYDTMDVLSSFFVGIIKRKRKFKVVYYNLELRFFDYGSILKREIGWFLEQLFILSADFFVGLSPIRLKLAEKVFRIPGKKFFIPNSFDFEVRKMRRKIYGRPKVIYAGGLEDYLIYGVAEHIKGGNFEFTFHGPSKYGLSHLKGKLNILKRKGIEIIDRVIPGYEDFKNFLEGFDIGFVWYSTDTINDTFVGLSSGKYFRYLSLGKPVIVRSLPEMAETTRENFFGVPISSFSEIEEAVEEISSNYHLYLDGIRENYHKFDFSKNFERLYNELVR